MTTIYEFIKQLKAVIISILPDDLKALITFTETSATKINDQKLLGLTFQIKGMEASPTFYVNQLYQRFQEGEALPLLANELASAFIFTTMQEPPQVAPDLSFAKVKDRLTLRLVEIARNHEYLLSRPYLEVGNGLALVVDIQLETSDENGVYSTSVTNDLVERYHYKQSELFRQAMFSAPVINPPVMNGITAKLFDPSYAPNLLADDCPMDEVVKEKLYVLTTKTGVFGAAALFYPKVQERIRQKLGEGFYVLPSSLHEFIIIPLSSGIDQNELLEMVKVANQEIVKENEILSDQPLIYDGRLRMLTITSTKEPATNNDLGSEVHNTISA